MAFITPGKERAHTDRLDAWGVADLDAAVSRRTLEKLHALALNFGRADVDHRGLFITSRQMQQHWLNGCLKCVET